ncbi:MAG: sulfatase-like hydrolase/transferase [Gammaproteobacteria bacterium]|nr:sulfatase-like hydrolase/transferase [Gammaproteobacteria bacterium]
MASEKPRNFLFLFSDQHTRRALGCMGHPVVKTPHLDSLAERGVLFTDAYTNAPICVPARASLATGRQVFEIEKWDNCQPYRGEQPSWGHRLMAANRRAVSIGKLHYRSEDDPNGFDDSLLPLHILDGTGMLHVILRDPLPSSSKFPALVRNAGGGESSYTQYDRDITQRTLEWLREEGTKSETPWSLFVSMVCPHPPWLAPQAFYDQYPLEDVDLPIAYGLDERPMHPGLEDFRHNFGVRDTFDELTLRKVTAAYYGMISYLDDNVGKIIKTLDDCGLTETTDILYASDHGESLGHKGMFSKCSMMEESVGIPMIFAGQGVTQGASIDTPTQLMDVFPTILQTTGVQPTDEDTELKGVSLHQLAAGERPHRMIVAEQHSAGCRSGVFMGRQGSMKYVHYIDYPAQLFDLATDPYELNDLAENPEHASQLRDLETTFRKILIPEDVDRRAKADQKVRLDAGGGAAVVEAQGSHGYTPAPGEKPNFG